MGAVFSLPSFSPAPPYSPSPFFPCVGMHKSKNATFRREAKISPEIYSCCPHVNDTLHEFPRQPRANRLRVRLFAIDMERDSCDMRSHAHAISGDP